MTPSLQMQQVAGFPLVEPFGEAVVATDLDNPALLARLTSRDIVSVDEVVSMSGAGGLSGDMARLHVTLGGGAKMSMVVKTTKPCSMGLSSKLGLAREAYFLHFFGERSRGWSLDMLPEVYFSCGDFARGNKLMILEDLQGAIQLGHFFGSGTPLNWNSDLTVLTAGAPTMTAEAASREAFLAYAKMHAMFWNDNSLLCLGYLRGFDWHQHLGQGSFEVAQKEGASYWAATKARIEENTELVKWAPELIAVMDASLSRISWDDFQGRVRTAPFTLVHGDAHPANMMWVPGIRRLVLLDFEVVGIGSGPQDLSQFLISHMAPAVRRKCEASLVREYYDALVQNGIDRSSYSWDACWHEYKMGGFERWVWLLALLTTMCPADMVQYWHDQMLAYMQDHSITPDNIGMPRV